MNTFINHVVDAITSNLKDVRGIVLSGSQQSDEIVDIWSDTDLLIVMDEGFLIDEQVIIGAINSIGFVVGSETYRSVEHSISFRTCISLENSIHLLDVKFCSYDEWILIESQKGQSYTIIFGDLKLRDKLPSLVKNYSFDSYESNNTWFKYFMAIKKFARNDNLIGLHLLLDLVRDFLVVELIERDIRYGTNIHRYGYGEQLPPNIEMSKLDITNQRAVFDYIDKLAYEYDKKLISNVKGYVSRYTHVANYLVNTKQRIAQSEGLN
ncbi:hypothetical protein MUG84_27115 [Paenibacillus sp. KQZ6P-2]|uniref:Uncharacterized protein n=1 Tax=Paenibacillus mangrovi TaxID=2931978 RepID=A0A9X2B990_9BACL|nr:hypothetical protein [Paenibacillus mangrovi]MCJ8015333.1 hypothetical protein [Paenibacillus mangrovi]